MAKKPISEKDWGRIYAFIWKKYKENPHPPPDKDYKKMFEENPASAIVAINKALLAEGYKGLDSFDVLFNIEDQPSDVDSTQLEQIIEGKVIAFLQTRLTC